MKKILGILTVMLMTISCKNELISNYKGEVVKYKGSNSKYYILQYYDSLEHKYKSHGIDVFEIDFKYNEGDTIK